MKATTALEKSNIEFNCHLTVTFVQYCKLRTTVRTLLNRNLTNKRIYFYKLYVCNCLIDIDKLSDNP